MTKERWTIPLDKVGHGIEKALNNANELRALGIGHLRLMNIELDEVGGTSKRPITVVPVLYYAIEELGKAMILFEKWEEARKNGVPEIIVGRNVGDHDTKMNKAKEAYGELAVKIREPLHGWENDFNFEPLIEKGEIIDNFMGRSNTWLASWNQEGSRWEEPGGWIDRGDVKSSFYRLEQILNEWFEKTKEVRN